MGRRPNRPELAQIDTVLLVHGKQPNNGTNNKQHRHELEYSDQLFSICGITFFVFLDPLLPRNFTEFAIVRWIQWFISGLLHSGWFTHGLCFANTRFSDLWISKHKALTNSLKNRLPKISRSKQAVDPK